MGFFAGLVFLFVGFVVFAVLGAISLPLLAVVGGVMLAIGVLWAAFSLLGLLLRVVFGVVFGLGGLLLGAVGFLIALPFVALFALLPIALPLLVILGFVMLVRWAARPSAPVAPTVVPATLPPATA